MQNKAMRPPLMFINKNSIDYKYNLLGDLKPRVKAHYQRVMGGGGVWVV
jgi:hypothetical protein